MSIKNFTETHGKPVDPMKLKGTEVIIIDNSHVALYLLSIIEADDLNKFRANDRHIQNVCNYLYTKDKFYTPRLVKPSNFNQKITCLIIFLMVLFRIDECCVVKYKDRWYRAYCLEVCFDGFITMSFIDYGNMALIEINDIRPIPDVLIFDCLTLGISFMFDFDGSEEEQTAILKRSYPEKSKRTIDSIEYRKDKDKFGDEVAELYCSFQKL